MDRRRYFRMLYRLFLANLSPYRATQVQFFRAHRYWPDFKNPRSFSERICVMKLNWRDQRFIDLSDKHTVKDWVRQKLGDDWVIPTIFCGNQLPKIEDRVWNAPFIIKARHGSAMFEIVRNPSDADWYKIEENILNWLNSDWAVELCEEWYNQIERGIIIEPLIGNDNSSILDYKFFVFRGKIACIQVDSGRFTLHTQDFFDCMWRPLPFHSSIPKSSILPIKPKNLNMMCEAAEELGREFDFVRVDLYDLPDGPRFGEMTFSPWAGFQRFSPREFDFWLGEFWKK